VLTGALQLSVEEIVRLVRIVCLGSSLRRRSELARLIRRDIQHFLPHQTFVSAWGDFFARDLQVDVIRSGARAQPCVAPECEVKQLLLDLHKRWLAGGRRPLLLGGAALPSAARGNTCGCAVATQLRAMRSVVLHGVRSMRGETGALYVAASADAQPRKHNHNIGRFRRIVELIIGQVDIAYRNLPASARGATALAQPVIRSVRGLSRREAEILTHVSLGRTNMDIATTLDISCFTVKNHVQRIIRKLGAANRTEAAALYRIDPPPAPVIAGNRYVMQFRHSSSRMDRAVELP
jgi:transcriptional regulator EpsA